MLFLLKDNPKVILQISHRQLHKVVCEPLIPIEEAYNYCSSYYMDNRSRHTLISDFTSLDMCM